MKQAPVFFVSHGAPTFALETGFSAKRLSEIGASFAKDNIKAVLVVSPHWQTQHIEVMTSLAPETIHDFYGFPTNLYSLQYRAKGHAELAGEAARLLAEGGLKVSLNHQRGLDHGAWVALLHLWPNADMLVFQVSMPATLSPAQAYKMGQLLAPMRKQGVLILGSGGITHNLNDFRQQPVELPYVSKFSQWIKQAIIENNISQLLAYRDFAPNASQAHPTDEHLLPLFIALGARSNDEHLEVIDGGVAYGILSMDAYLWQAKLA